MIKIKKFNALTIEELYSILNLRSEVFVVEQNCVYQDIDGKDQASYHVFIKQKEVVIAYLRIVGPSTSAYNAPSIGRVVVAKQHRKQGYAIAIMLKAIDFVYEEMQEDTIVISAQQYLVDFYKSLGFILSGDGYLEDGIPHIKMIHTLKKD